MLRSFKTRLSALRREENGAVAVEFALLAPLLFALLFGIIATGYAISIQHSIHQLATSAARASLEGLDTEERIELADAYLSNAGTHYAVLDGSLFAGEGASNVKTVTVTGGDTPSITVNITYPLENSMLAIANGFLGTNFNEFSAEAYLAY